MTIFWEECQSFYLHYKMQEIFNRSFSSRIVKYLLLALLEKIINSIFNLTIQQLSSFVHTSPSFMLALLNFTVRYQFCLQMITTNAISVKKCFCIFAKQKMSKYHSNKWSIPVWKKERMWQQNHHHWCMASHIGEYWLTHMVG